MANAMKLGDPARRRTIAKLQIERKSRGLADEDDWRDFVERQTGERQLRHLDARGLQQVLDALVGSSPSPASGRTPAPSSSVRLSGPYAGKLRALWLSGWNLGVVRNRSDEALLAFVKRQTGLDHDRFLRDGRSAARVIEALKDMLARDGGVMWEGHEENPRRAIVEAQWRRLAAMHAIGFYVPGDSEDDALLRYAGKVAGGKAAFHFFTEEDWDAVIRALGNKLRREIAREAGEPPCS